MNYVLDASAMVAYLRQEYGCEVVEGLLTDTSNSFYAHAVNLMEVFYDHRRSGGEDAAQGVLRALANVRVQAQELLDPPLWQDAARIKADCARVSLADCCGLALARRLGAAFLSTDKHELDRDEIRSLCPIVFIR